MDFIKIDKEKWQRKKVFELYSKDILCTYSMTINLDITGLKNKIEIKQLKFFPVILYGLSKFVTKQEMLKDAVKAGIMYDQELDADIRSLRSTILYGLKGISAYGHQARELGYYDEINPIFTVFEEAQEQFYQVWTKYDDDFEVFYQNYLLDMKNYQQQEIKSSKLLLEKNVFNVSCVPQVSFTGFNLNLAKGYDYYLPIFTIGKYFEQGEKILLPLAIQVHHGVCDGFHLSRFINDLQEWLDKTDEI